MDAPLSVRLQSWQDRPSAEANGARNNKNSPQPHLPRAGYPLVQRLWFWRQVLRAARIGGLRGEHRFTRSGSARYNSMQVSTADPVPSRGPEGAFSGLLPVPPGLIEGAPPRRRSDRCRASYKTVRWQTSGCNKRGAP